MKTVSASIYVMGRGAAFRIRCKRRCWNQFSASINSGDKWAVLFTKEGALCIRTDSIIAIFILEEKEVRE